MQEVFAKRSVQVVLGAAVLLIWGYNMLSIAGISSDETDEADGRPITVNTLPTLPESTPYEYQADFRDPFRPQLRLSPVKKPVERARVVPDLEHIRFPVLSLRGVIGGTAMIQNPSHSVFFVRTGDTVEQSVVRFVRPDFVVLEYKGRSFTISLNK